jgi:putative transposase
MCISISKSVVDDNLDFSIWDSISYSDPSLPFGNILSADQVRELFADNDALFGSGEKDVWNTGLTLWSFIGQILGDGKQRSCNAAVTHATRYCLEHGLEPPGAHSGDYCRARQKLNAAVVKQLACHIAQTLSHASPDCWLWLGKRIKLVDGFTFTMPDTPDNQEGFPQSGSQKSGIGFPITRTCVVLSLACACIEAIAIGPYAGKNTGESALLRQVLDCFKPGEVLLADRYFCSFFMLAILKSRGIDVCMQLHQRRGVDASKVTWIGPNEYIDIWHRPQKAKWTSPELYDTIPERLPIRIVMLDAIENRRVESLDIVTTFLDPKAYPASDIARLFGYRWNVELDIRGIKQSLNLDHVRCKSPDMVERELWTTLLAYNLVRWVCAQAAMVHDKLPRQMSFTAGCNVLLSQWLMPPDPSIRQTQGQHNLFQIACNEVADRPGRIEPRVVKRRPKEYPLMTKPRNQYKQEKTQNTAIAGKRGLKA